MEADLVLPTNWRIGQLQELIHNIEPGNYYRYEKRTPLGGEIGVLKTSSISKGKYMPLESNTVLEP